MNFEEFKRSLSDSTPLSDSSAYLQSLWYDAKGDWNKAHEIIQNIEDKNDVTTDYTGEHRFI